MSPTGTTLSALDRRMAELQSVEDPVAGLAPALGAVVEDAMSGRPPGPEEAQRLACYAPGELPSLCRAASVMRDRGQGRTVTFSPKVFIPVTRLCRDFCGYCTFRQDPQEAEQLFMTPEQVLDVARAGQRLGCAEALLTLGERPEQRYPEAGEWLDQRGYRTTLDYIADLAGLILRETSLLPHANPGTMSHREARGLKEVTASMGLMLENVSDRLREPGGPHELAPSKSPAVRLKTLEIAGRLKIPFTTGVLIGIGETPAEVVDSLLSIRESHARYGHVQETIVQNFRAKPDTAMAGHSEPESDYLLWAVATARIILGPEASIQVPPNLSAAGYPIYLLAGINDWGGVSPLTPDYVNPEAPWPQIRELRDRTEGLGFELKPRLTIYPEYLGPGTEYVAPGVIPRVRELADEGGYLRGGMERYDASLV